MTTTADIDEWSLSWDFYEESSFSANDSIDPQSPWPILPGPSSPSESSPTLASSLARISSPSLGSSLVDGSSTLLGSSPVQKLSSNLETSPFHGASAPVESSPNLSPPGFGLLPVQGPSSVQGSPPTFVSSPPPEVKPHPLDGPSPASSMDKWIRFLPPQDFVYQPKQTRHEREQGVIRTPNAFLHFRSLVATKVSRGESQKEISRIAGLLWTRMPENIKTKWHALAAKTKEKHGAKQLNRKNVRVRRRSVALVNNAKQTATNTPNIHPSTSRPPDFDNVPSSSRSVKPKDVVPYPSSSHTGVQSYQSASSAGTFGLEYPSLPPYPSPLFQSPSSNASCAPASLQTGQVYFTLQDVLLLLSPAVKGDLFNMPGTNAAANISPPPPPDNTPLAPQPSLAPMSPALMTMAQLFTMLLDLPACSDLAADTFSLFTRYTQKLTEASNLGLLPVS